MNSRSNDKPAEVRRRQRVRGPLTHCVRPLAPQVSLRTRQLGAQLDLRDTDLDSLDLIASHGPLSPSVLARRARLHPATLTGILDRLERGGWVARERDPADRRAVLIRAQRESNGEITRLYARRKFD